MKSVLTDDIEVGEWLDEIGSVNFVPDSEVQDVVPLESKARTGA